MARKSGTYRHSSTRGKAHSGPTKEAGKIDSIMGAEYHRKAAGRKAGR